MKATSVLIALAAVAMFSVPAQANQCCELPAGVPGGPGCMSAAAINAAGCASVGGVFTNNEFCNTTTGTCDPKPGGDGGAVCQGVPANACCNVTNGAAPICQPIPTMSEWGLVVMTVLLLTTGTVILGWRRRTATA
ncbi:MAG: IPTL-CTERM sorting domain-containing protein [Phycisphaerae bacterium]